MYSASICQRGQQRRCGPGPGFYLRPHPVWILDEPLTAIDRSGVAAFGGAFAWRNAANGGTVDTEHASQFSIILQGGLRLPFLIWGQVA